MNFPLARWIDTHSDCRHNLGTSGMFGSIRHPNPTAREIRSADPFELRAALGGALGIGPDRVFLTHGATESNATVLHFLARRSNLRGRRCRVAFPEYPPLWEVPRALGLRPDDTGARAAVGIVSQPRNPEGDRWTATRLIDWAEGVGELVVDETFREFARLPSFAALPDRPVWTTGSLTKFYAGDDLRVGFVVAPPAPAGAFGRYHSLVADDVSPYSVAAALACLRAHARIRREVERVLGPNRAAWEAAFPRTKVPLGPVGFDRAGPGDGDALALRCLDASVLVCPGRFFGDPRGVRLGLTRRSFPRDLAAYLEVRQGLRAATRAHPTPRKPSPPARPRRGRVARARAGRG